MNTVKHFVFHALLLEFPGPKSNHYFRVHIRVNLRRRNKATTIQDTRGTEQCGSIIDTNISKGENICYIL